MSFGRPFALQLDAGLTVVTGPNAAGKSNVGRCLDAARAVLAGHGDSEGERLALYDDAGFEGATDFTIKLDIELDQPWERDLVRAHVKAVYLTSGPLPRSGRSESLEESWNWLADDSLDPLMTGTLVIRHNSARVRRWSADWEFNHGSNRPTWHAVLVGDTGIDALVPGPAANSAQRGGTMFANWLLEAKPRDEVVLDFREALRNSSQAVVFLAQAQSDRSGAADASVRDLSARLGLDPQDRSFSFAQIMRAIIRRGVVLTDNRRVPLTQVFPVSALSGPADLRDGAAVGAEIFRMKIGGAEERARFREVQLTFRKLTGRELEVRARPINTEDGVAALIIEPVVVGHHGERLVELSGAGIQEALLLSVLLHGESGRIVVLDEPAVNLEPTVQRRLLRQVRGPGQYLVITHNAALVPFDDPADLQRIVRITPGQTGSEIRRPDYSDVLLKDQLRQLQLLEPAEVRSLLFATAVIMCEGQTETGALPRWWEKVQAVQPSMVAVNVAFISVGGHNSFGRYVRFLDAFAIPWAIVADGPALRNGSKLSEDMRRLGHLPDQPQPEDEDDFEQWRAFWETAGIFSLARQFGDDGGKRGELEALLEQIDPGLHARATKEAGGSKSRAGAYFAAEHPDPPEPVADIFNRIDWYLGFG